MSLLSEPWGTAHWFAVGAILLCLIKRKSLGSLRKYVAVRIRVHFHLRRLKRSKATIDLRRNDLSPVDLGIVPSPSQYELEHPRRTFKDGIHFAGISSEGHLIDVCLDRIERNVALVWVYLRLADGTVYQSSTSGDARRAYVANGHAFVSSGLHIRCLSPLRKWRIAFNGLLLRKRVAEEWIHTKFSFVWLAMSGVQEQRSSYEEGVLTDALIRGNSTAQREDLVSLQEIGNRCEQWGQMLGTITFKGQEEKNFYFWALRTRISGSPRWDVNMDCARFYMYFVDDGTPLKVERLSIQNCVSNLTSGFGITPYGAVKQISRCDLDAFRKEAKDFAFSCSVGRQTKEIRIEFTGGATAFHIGPHLELRVDLLPFRVRANDCDEGFGILHHIANSREGRRSLDLPLLLLKDPGHSCDKRFLRLEDEMCTSSVVAGGKGSSLAMLTRLATQTDEFVVPRGFVITTTAFEDHLRDHPDIRDAALALRDVACKIRGGDLKTECERCTSIFGASQLSEHLKKEMRSVLRDVYGPTEDVSFSVRSSAFGEDSEDLSAAGQMLTLLGVRGVDNVFRAVIQCWSSKFGFEAIQYCRQNGQPLSHPMAVVVQEMVPSDFSGVLFTVDPVTGDPTHPYITANFGLGESVVSALADPDTVVLRRNPSQSLEVFETRIGAKKTQVFMKASGDVESKQFESRSETSCLTGEWAVKIGEAGILIESCFCGPRDIEWAVRGNRLYILQARPITTLHCETDFELIHDQDTPVRSTQDFWTRANTGEVFLGATSPLGISIVVTGMDINGHRGHVLREKRFDEYCPFFFHILPATHRQITINLVDVLFKHNEEEVSPVQRAFEAALFGRAVITPEMHRAGIKKYGYASRAQKYIGLLVIPMFSYTIPRTVDKLDREIRDRNFTLDACTTARETYDGILAQMNFCCQVFGAHGMTTFLSSYFNMLLMTVLSKGKKEWDAELYCDFATTLSSCSGVESAEVPENLQELARAIAREFGSAFSALSVHAAHDLLRDETTTPGKLFKNFLERHGHRCVKEFDLYSKSWGMEPVALVPTLQNLVKSPNVLKVAPKEILSTEDILTNLKTPLTLISRRILKFLLPRCRRHVCQRERTKSMLIKTVDWLRKSCRHLGDRMVREGLMPDPELVFFLTLEEIQEILDSQKPGLVPKAVRRKRLHPQLDQIKFPEIMKGIPKPIQSEPDLTSYTSSFTLTGTPVCEGTVKGKAVVVMTLEEASEIREGDVLITHATDVGWSPYFPLLSGVVTVLGGLISHGAVVAREFGLPCVVGVENATLAFSTGDTVVLNGTKGTVTKVTEEERTTNVSAGCVRT